ncbi:hypothetical protein V6N13_088353 [Hibiscus sabdariffa]
MPPSLLVTPSHVAMLPADSNEPAIMHVLVSTPTVTNVDEQNAEMVRYNLESTYNPCGESQTIRNTTELSSVFPPESVATDQAASSSST